MLGLTKPAVTFACLSLLTAAAHAEDFRLQNGLHVVLAPDPNVNNVALVVSYETGSGSDPAQYRGLAHLVEHLTFRGSRHLLDGQGTDMIEATGGGSNAYTYPDRTMYVAVLPRAALPLGLWIERERMAFALDGIDQAALELERKIVRNEVHQRAGLHWLLGMQRQRSLYGLPHPYASEDAAYFDDVSAISLPDVQWFFQSSHRPDNATLVLVGAFAADEARPLIERYFAPVRNPELQRASLHPPAPKQCGVHRVELGHYFLQGRMLSVTWTLLPPSSAPEHMTLRALQQLLDGRISEQLVRGSFEASSVSVRLDHRKTHSLLHLEVMLHDRTDFARVEARVTKVASELAARALSEAELRSLRGELVTQAVLAREDPLEQAMAIAVGFDSIHDREHASALDAPSLQRAAAQLTGHRLVVSARPSQAVSHGTDILAEDNPCR